MINEGKPYLVLNSGVLGNVDGLRGLPERVRRGVGASIERNNLGDIPTTESSDVSNKVDVLLTETDESAKAQIRFEREEEIKLTSP